jgi:hypothetical protein
VLVLVQTVPLAKRGTAESRNQKELLFFSFVALSIRRNGLWSARPVSNPSNWPSGFPVAFPLLVFFFLETRVPCCVCRIVPQTNIYTRGHSFVENLKRKKKKKKRVAHNIRNSAQIQTPTTIKKQNGLYCALSARAVFDGHPARLFFLVE